MKKYLVLVGMGSSVIKTQLSSVNVDMPDYYDPMGDNPGDIKGYPLLRQAIYEHKKSDNVYGKAEYSKFDPDSITVMGISYIGQTMDHHVGQDGAFNAANIMGGDDVDDNRPVKVNPRLIAKFHDGGEIFKDIIAFIGPSTARTIRVATDQTEEYGGHWTVTLKVRDERIRNVVDKRLNEMMNHYIEYGRRVMLGVLFGEYGNDDIRLIAPEE